MNYMAKEYGNESIQQLVGPDQVKLRPAVYLGSNTIEGARHTFMEILTNSVDEAKSGHGTELKITKNEDGSVTVEDFGRGIPMDYNNNLETYNWDLLFTQLYAGGKYGEDGSAYTSSGGLNGLGLAVTQMASEYMEAHIKRDGYEYKMRFEDGYPVTELEKTKLPKGEEKVTGSKITWKLNDAVFIETDIAYDYMKDIVDKQAIVNDGVKFIMKDLQKDVEDIYYYEKGIYDYIKEITNDFKDLFVDPIKIEVGATGRDSENKDKTSISKFPEYHTDIEMYIAFTDEEPLLEYYHNSLPLDYGGAPENALKNGIVTAIDREIKNQKLYKAKEKMVTFNDIEESLVFISHSTAPANATSYENQTKKAITNPLIQTTMNEGIKDFFETWFIENQSDAKKIVHQILANKRSRETAEKQRQVAKKAQAKNRGKSSIMQIKKFTPCKLNDNRITELFIAEGKPMNCPYLFYQLQLG